MNAPVGLALVLELQQRLSMWRRIEEMELTKDEGRIHLKLSDSCDDLILITVVGFENYSGVIVENLLAGGDDSYDGFVKTEADIQRVLKIIKANYGVGI